MADKIKCPGCGADVDPETGCAEFHEPPPGFEPIDDTDDEAATDEGNIQPTDPPDGTSMPAAADRDPAEQSADPDPVAESLPVAVTVPPRRKFGWKPRQ